MMDMVVPLGEGALAPPTPFGLGMEGFDHTVWVHGQNVHSFF
jgi:hypothetical protein